MSLLIVNKYYSGTPKTDKDHLLRGLDYHVPAFVGLDQTYLQAMLTADKEIDLKKSLGLWENRLRPWVNVWVPGSKVEDYIGDVLPNLKFADVGYGSLILYPHRREHFKRPFLQLPDEEWIFLFDILTVHRKRGDDPRFLQDMLTRNRELYDKAAGIGGTRCPIGSVPFQPEDWQRQYGDDYAAFKALKATYDPTNILTPGLNI